MGKKPSLILADDHQVLLSGLRGMLESEFKIVATATDGRMLMAEAIKHRPDLILTDVSMPELNGIEAIFKIRAAGLESRVVVLSMHIDTTYAGRALQAGAMGYVLKTESPEVVVEALKKALRGEHYFSDAFAAALDALKTRDADQSVTLLGRLTHRQLEVLKLLCEGYAAKQVADRLGVSPRTAEFHKYRIMEILNVKSNAELVAYAMRHGLV